MYFYSQNLTDSYPNKTGKLMSMWRHGRCWLRKNRSDYRGRELHCEWGFGKFSQFCHIKINFGEGDSNDAVNVSISIPHLFYVYIGIDKIFRCKECQAGVSIYDNSILFYPLSYTNESNSRDPWYRKSIYWNFPWKYEWYKTEVLSLDKSTTIWQEVVGDRKGLEERNIASKTVSATYPYRYVRKNGEIQDVNATIYVDRITHRMKWFPFIKKSWTGIDVRFNKEVGDGVDSWKGGCTGCSYNLLETETPEQCLRRMEIERKFER